MAAVLAVLLIAACSIPDFAPPPQPRAPRPGQPKISKPYKIRGVWYYPQADPYYDRKGVASWYGRQFHGNSTANGERFNMNGLSAAHTTLPMPSLVRVTNLHNGRSLVLRVNDRGPFVRGRIIDVSRRAAQLLGFERRGVARVRVQAVGPDGRYPAPAGRRQVVVSRQLPPTGPPARKGPVARPAMPEKVLTREVRPTVLYVQAGAYIDHNNAFRIADGLDAIGPTSVSRVTVDGRQLYRVRVGPLTTIEEADAALQRVVAGGNGDARIVIE